MKSIALILLLMIVSSSCTVERRVHRPGWNVQWLKRDRVAKSEHVETKKSKTTDETNVISAQVDADKRKLRTEKEGVSEVVSPEKSESSVQDVPANLNEDQSLYQNHAERNTAWNASNIDAESSKKTTSKQAEGGNSRVGLAILFMVLALVFIGLAFLCYFAAVATAHWGWALLYVLGILAFTSIAICLLVFGIIQLTSALNN